MDVSSAQATVPRPNRLAVLMACGVICMVSLVGCGSSSKSASPGSGSDTPIMPADSPLTRCVDPEPARSRPVDTAISRHLTGGRVTSQLSLDGGAFRASPPARTATPRISDAQAYCNLLAGVDSSNRVMIDSLGAHGVSFGLGVLTVSDSVIRARQFTPVGPDFKPLEAPHVHVARYHSRLAWIAVFEPEVVTSCPAMQAVPSPTSGPRAAPQKELPGYQIIAIDAETGASGILYSATTDNFCGRPGTRGPSIAPAQMFVSLPWTFTKRGPGPKNATITYAARSCDEPISVFSDVTEQPVVSPDEGSPARVDVVVSRDLETCGPAKTVSIGLQSATRRTDLPTHLIHAPTGARDVTH